MVSSREERLREGFCFLSKAGLIIFIRWLEPVEREQEGRARRGWLMSRVPERDARAQIEGGQMWRTRPADTEREGGREGACWGTESDRRQVGARVRLTGWEACKSGLGVRGWRRLPRRQWRRQRRADPGRRGVTLRVSVFIRLLRSAGHRCWGCRVEWAQLLSAVGRKTGGQGLPASPLSSYCFFEGMTPLKEVRVLYPHASLAVAS